MNYYLPTYTQVFIVAMVFMTNATEELYFEVYQKLKECGIQPKFSMADEVANQH